MRWPIRNQILVPVATLVTAAVTLIAVTSAVLAARHSEADTLQHLRQVISAIAQPSFPLVPNVLEKMRGLSGAEFLVCAPNGELLASTLKGDIPDKTILRSVPETAADGSLTSSPVLSLHGQRYFSSSTRVVDPAGVKKLIVLYPVRSWQQARTEAILPPLTLGAVTIVLTVLLSAWLAQRFSQRLQTVEKQVAAIAQGEFIEIATGTRQDEIHKLALSVNQMSRQLRQMRETIGQSERARLLGQLAGGLAHQLRNSVTGARLAVQVHARRCSHSPADDSLTVALRQLSLTEEQIKGFLSLGRQEQHPAETCSIPTLVAEVIALIRPACEHAQVEYQSRIDDNLPCMIADVRALRGAILNLALNALEAAGPGGQIRLVATFQDTCQEQAGALALEVWDTGPGPPDQLAESLGQPFVTGKTEGVGLGLMLVRQVATDHGGQLTWHRAAHQTCFRMSLPVGRGPESVDPPMPTG